MKVKRVPALVVAALVVMGACSSSTPVRSAPKPCRVLRLTDARALLGEKAITAPLSGSPQNPVCTYVVESYGRTPPSVVLHLRSGQSPKSLGGLGRFAKSPPVKTVHLRGLVGNATWMVETVGKTPTGSAPATPQVVSGMLVFARGGVLVQIDVGGTGNDFTTAKSVARLVIARIG